jgi:glycosyltransferase involved in cell wall biosynthesis
VDCEQFRPAAGDRDRRGPLRLLFVGTINQRKGIKYLLDAMQMLDPADVELTVCGRVVDDLPLFRHCPANIRVRPSVSAGELLDAYQSADLFVFPSLAEGFAHVLLESLACGLPILSTERTAAPDLIRHGEQGFLVRAGSATAIAQQIDEVLRNRPGLPQMRLAARRTAESFSWARFRRQTAQFVREVCERPHV